MISRSEVIDKVLIQIQNDLEAGVVKTVAYTHVLPALVYNNSEWAVFGYTHLIPVTHRLRSYLSKCLFYTRIHKVVNLSFWQEPNEVF